MHNKSVFLHFPINERYMNEPRLYPNESDLEYKMTNKNLKELKVTTYINKMHRPFKWLNHKNSTVKHVFL